MKVIVANSVGIDSNRYAMVHSPSRWTNSYKDLNVFTYYPWELAYTSSLLKRDTNYEVLFLDGCLKKLDFGAYYKKIAEHKPDFLIMESCTRTILEDSRLAKAIKKDFNTKLIFCGQHATGYPDEVAKFADYVCLGEYEYTVLEILQGKKREDILGIYPNKRRPLLDINTLPWPEDEDVSRLAYGNPGEPSCEYLEIQAYASRGCPMQCNFCVCANMYYAKPNWRPRNVDNIISEITYLRKKYPQLEGIFFDEEVHNANKKFVLALTKAICEHGLNDLHYNVMCGYWTMDQEMLMAMKNAGYYMLRVGIETADEKTAAAIGLGKKFNIAKLKEILKIAKDIGLKMYGTFTFGAAGSSDEGDKKTIKLLDELITKDLLWRFQLSICTPQPGTPYFLWAKKNGFLKDVEWEKFDGGNFSVVDYPHYNSTQILENYKTSEKFYDMAYINRSRNAIEQCMLNIPYQTVTNILLFRTARMWQVERILNGLKKRYPMAKVMVMTQPIVEEELRLNNNIDNVLTYTNDFLCLDKLSEGIKQEIKMSKFDLAIIPYNNPQGKGYEEVERVAAYATSCHKIGVGIECELFEVVSAGKREMICNTNNFC
ncbi:MAG: radical SAM protein [bacterium]